MTINKAGLDLIKRAEGFEPQTYVDPVGILTIGYGTTAAAGVGIIPKMGMRISEAQASRYLEAALEKFWADIAPAIRRPINENEKAAFMSLAYNIGTGAFKGSTALRRFNAGDKPGAADAIQFWNKGTVKGQKIVLAGLVKRRADERWLFLRPASVMPIAPIDPPLSSFWVRFFAFFANIFKKAQS